MKEILMSHHALFGNKIPQSVTLVYLQNAFFHGATNNPDPRHNRYASPGDAAVPPGDGDIVAQCIESLALNTEHSLRAFRPPGLKPIAERLEAVKS